MTRIKINYINDAIALFIFSWMATGCAEMVSHPEMEPLSQSIENLSKSLEKSESCANKKRVIDAWLENNLEKLQEEKKKFDTKCRVGNRSDITCMSHHLLSTGRVEVMLDGCKNDDGIRASIARVNEIAGTGILGVQ